MQKKNCHANKFIHQLQNKLNNIKNKMNETKQETLNEILKNSDLPTCQIELVKEIFLAAKVKNPKNRRYSENWMLLCMLFQIRFVE